MRSILLAACAALGALAWANQEGPSAMRAAARSFHAVLDEARLARGVFPLHAAERRDWHYVPRERKGLALRDLEPNQRKLLRALLRTTLSAAGERKLDEIIALEDLLRELESTPNKAANWRDPEAYTVALFGDVTGPDPWSWRFEGHHVVLHFTEVGRELSITPHFLGTNPARSERGGKVVEPLADEQRLARELAQLLEGNVRSRAVLAAPVPGDVLLTPGVNTRFDPLDGVALSELPASARALADELIAVYAGRFEGAALERARANVSAADALRFVWIGATAPGQPHYYRLHGPRFAIEYQNSQNDARHVHTLWREYEGDFGGLSADAGRGADK